MTKKNYQRDFFAEAKQLLKNQGYRFFIERLLIGGKWQNNEWVVRNPTRADDKAGSFSINGKTGKWADFATNEGGNDLISLTAYVKGISLIDACFYIGVLPPESSEFKNDKKEVLKSVTATITALKKEYAIEDLPASLISPDELTEDKPTEESACVNNNELPLHSPIPEFTKDLIGRKIKDKFKGGEITLYPYYSSHGIPVGCVVRCDKDIAGDKVKDFTQYSYDRTKGQWQSGWSEQGKPPYNLQEIVACPDKLVMIVEGEKTAEAAKLLFPEFVVTTSCMGASAARSTNWSFLRGRDIIIAPDNDSQGAKYAGHLNDILQRAEAKSINGFDSKKLGRFTIVDGKPTRRDAPVPDKYDLADSSADGWTAELIEEWRNHADFTPFFEATSAVQTIRDLPQEGEELFYIGGVNYKLNKTKNSLWWEKIKTDGRTGDTTSTWLPLSGYMKPTHCTEDINGNHGLLVRIITRRRKEVECFFAREEMATEKDTTKLLLAKGLTIPNLKPDNCYALNFYLNNFEPKFKAIGVDMVGWQGENEAYILPFANEPRNSYSSKQEGEEKTEYILQYKGGSARTLKKKGTLEEWKRTVGAVCKGNHLHSFAILVSLTAPALKLLGEEGGFIHYVGNTSIGKSTILHVAKSVWGFENLGSFRTTDNGLEDTCKNANDGLLFLDEIGEADPEAFFKIIYMLANGVTKTRADRSGNAKATTFFTVLAQSTGEIGLEAKLAEKNKKAKGGQLMRMAELDADRGKNLNTFDVLNVNPDTKELFTSGREQAEYLKIQARENCGVVIDNFLQKMVADIDEYKKSLIEAKARWLKYKLTGDEGVEVTRMAKRFSTIFASGVIAVGIGILPFSMEEVEDCLDIMFSNWLDRFGGDSSYEFKEMISDLRKLTTEQRDSRFHDVQTPLTEIKNLSKDKAGYYKTEKDANGDTVFSEFWFYPSVFEREVLKGRDRKVFYPLLVKEGYLKREDDKNYTQSKKPKSEDKRRFIVISAAALNECY